jgi:uncharacterized protein HemX
MPTDEEKEEDAADEEEDEELEESEEEADEEPEEEDDEDADFDVVPAATGGPSWGFWRIMFALLIIAVVALAGWLGWQYMAAQEQRAAEIAEKEADTKKALLQVAQELRSAQEDAAQGDLDALLANLEAASKTLALAGDRAIDEMRPSLDAFSTKLDAAKQDVRQRRDRLQAQTEKEAKEAEEAVSAVLTSAEAILNQQYAPEDIEDTE